MEREWHAKPRTRKGTAVLYDKQCQRVRKVDGKRITEQRKEKKEQSWTYLILRVLGNNVQGVIQEQMIFIRTRGGLSSGEKGAEHHSQRADTWFCLVFENLLHFWDKASPGKWVCCAGGRRGLKTNDDDVMIEYGPRRPYNVGERHTYQSR